MTFRARASLLLALPLMLAAAPHAFAHAILIKSTPAVGGTLPDGQNTIKLTFNSKIDLHRSRVTIAGPDTTGAEAQKKLSGTGTAAGNEFDTTVTLTKGAYILRWQALALDGHITRGEVPFTAQ